ncbi:hypothetical protein DFJ65_0470 [Calidifontibacter indicus]|uniref:Uncharacterized protein n=1 Tax=Calidifontibacter indicus TaxID=419650 RepID=A0A3D9UJN1_9MICO|nr:hypothetical protein DFJ65_0470 [Calidifontibacter indicus]
MNRSAQIGLTAAAERPLDGHRLPAVGHLRDHAYRELRSELISVTALAARLCQRHGLSINA